jgi:uncharacterized protein YbaR (Trm112 family)
MTSDFTPPPAFDSATLDTLACPACLGTLRQKDSRLACAACGRSYPVVDGIPVLIVDRAENLPN